MKTELTNYEIIMDMAKNNNGIVTVRHIYTTLGHTDGGKMLRRHLRNRFWGQSNHTWNGRWEWKSTDPIVKEIIEFAETLGTPASRTPSTRKPAQRPAAQPTIIKPSIILPGSPDFKI